MNMKKYASYKKAAKRIVRLLNEERELKKEAGFWDWLFSPVGKKAPQVDESGKPLGLKSPSAEVWHPYTYLSYDDAEGHRYGVPLSWLTSTPECPISNESHENYNLSTGEYRPTFLPPAFDTDGSIARERNRINKATSEYWKKKNAK